MSDEEGSPTPLGAGGSAAAEAIVLGSKGTLDPRVAAYLEKQGKLTDLQSASLIEQNAFELSHLRWRRFNDRLRGVWQIILATISVGIFVGLCAMLWNAHQARGLVVEPLHTPPDFAAKGLDGTVLAQRLIDKLNGLVVESGTFVIPTADTITGNWGNDSKVEIPQTGASVEDISRALRGWLGNQTRMNGEVWREGDSIVLAVRSSNGTPIRFAGRESDLDALLYKAAEAVFAQVQPVRNAGLAIVRGQMKKAMTLLNDIAHNGAPADRPWAFEALSPMNGAAGRFRESIENARRARELQPNDFFAIFSEGIAQAALGHEEQAISLYRRAREVAADNPPKNVSPSVLRALKIVIDGSIARTTGAYEDSAVLFGRAASETFARADLGAARNISTSQAQDHDPLGARRTISTVPGFDDAIGISNFQMAGDAVPYSYSYVFSGDWEKAAQTLERTDRKAAAMGTAHIARRTFLWPWLVISYAHLGRHKDAGNLVALTPLDCQHCLSARGTVASLAGDHAASDAWFARSAAATPSLPFANRFWGEALLRRGEFEQAIGKFAASHKQGPHYADPLALWGEALVAKNRSDLALAKFEEAARYAPRWGRLYLKWGEAYLWLGRKDEARKRLARADRLFLLSSERKELTAMRARL